MMLSRRGHRISGRPESRCRRGGRDPSDVTNGTSGDPAYRPQWRHDQFTR
jgi:hypothetical protein